MSYDFNDYILYLIVIN